MRICLLTLDFPPYRSSGLTVYAEQLTRGLTARGHHVTVIASRRPDSERIDDLRQPDGVSVIRVPVHHLDWVGFGWQAAKYLRSQGDDFDVIHFADVHFAYAHRGAFVASAFQSFRQRLTSHNGRPYHTNWRNYLFRLVYYNGARRLMEQPTVQRARHIIMPSAATQQEFIDQYGVEMARTSLVYPGIDLGRFDALPERDEARRRLGLPDLTPILLYVGFSTPRKGVEYLAEALTRMETQARLMMVGKWEPHYQERFLEALGDSRSRVRIVGYVPDAELLNYFAAADVFVLATLLEGFGFPLVEAMAAGVPVVTTTGGSAGEIVGDAGLTVPVGDSRRLARALDRVLTERGLADRLSQAGRARAHARFDQARVAGELEAVYERVYE